MRLTSQLITETFQDLDKVERLNIEAFPEEERIPYRSFYAIRIMMTLTFFAFTMRKNLSDLPLLFQMLRPFTSVSFCHYASLCGVTAMVKEIIEKLVEFTNGPCC